MARIAIIGCGYVGTQLARRLLAEGHDVWGTTTTSQRQAGLAAAGIAVRRLRLDHTDQLHELFLDRDAVVCCAGVGTSGDYREVYLAGMHSLLAAVVGTNVRRVVYTSSTRVYGQSDGRWVDESCEPEPADERGRVLLQAECVLLDAASAMGSSGSAAVLRLGGIHGPGRELSERIRRASGMAMPNADAFVNLIHVDDVVSALALLCTSSYAGALNLVDDRPEPRRQLYDRVLAERRLAPVRWIDSSDRHNSLGKRVRNTLIKTTLGLKLAFPTH
ncbi:MAG: SDR family oxidoreductase [Phycisphaerae bacterium]